MNIFILDLDHQKNVSYYVEKHITKMPLETVQLLSTAVRTVFKETYPDKELPEWLQGQLYKPSHKNHPCSLWLRKSHKNAMFLCDLGYALFKEFNYRRGKQHGSWDRFLVIKHWISSFVEQTGFPMTEKVTKPAIVVPDKYLGKNVVKSYRAYYMGDKKHLANWGKRPIPEWWK